MNCKEFRAQIHDYVDSYLDAKVLRAFTTHENQCSECQQAAEKLRQLKGQLAGMETPSPSLRYQSLVTRALQMTEQSDQEPVTFLRDEKESSNGKTIWFYLVNFRHYLQVHTIRAYAAGFASAIILVIGIWLFGSFPHDVNNSDLQTFVVSVNEPKTIQLVINSAQDLKAAKLVLHLPNNVELSGYKGRHELKWTTDLVKGSNRLSLPVLPLSAGRGMLTTQIEHDGKKKFIEFNIDVIQTNTRNSEQRHYI